MHGRSLQSYHARGHTHKVPGHPSAGAGAGAEGGERGKGRARGRGKGQADRQVTGRQVKLDKTVVGRTHARLRQGCNRSC